MTGEYTIAVHVLVFLNHHKGETFSSDALADNVCTNPARIRKVMARLKTAGLVGTKEGAIGGYHFTENAEKITLLMVLEALDQTVVSVSWKSGDPDKACLIASGMADIMDEIYLALDVRCREELAQMTIADIDRKIFKN